MISELPMTEKDTVLVWWGPDRQYSLEELVDDVDARNQLKDYLSSDVGAKVKIWVSDKAPVYAAEDYVHAFQPAFEAIGRPAKVFSTFEVDSASTANTQNFFAAAEDVLKY